MRGRPRLPSLRHMPFPALARGEAWLLLEECAVPFVGAALVAAAEVTVPSIPAGAKLSASSPRGAQK